MVLAFGLFPLTSLAAVSKPDVPAAHAPITIAPGQFAWSPDGTGLAYADAQGLWTIHQPDFDRRVQLVKWTANTVESLTWSSDAKRLAFVAERPGDNWTTIWVVNSDGSHLTDTLPPDSMVESPGQRAISIEAWLDNHRIAFSMHCGTGAFCNYIVDLDSQKDFLLCDSEGGLTWSADHQKAVVEDHPSLVCTLQTLGVVQASMATPVVQRMQVRTECPSSFGGCLDSCCPPDSAQPKFDSWQPPPPSKPIEYVLYTSCKLKGSDLMLWDLDGSQKPLVADASDGQWSPDGTQIALRLKGTPRLNHDHALIGANPGPERTAIIDFPERRLIALAQPLQSLAWSPQGHVVAGKGADHALYVLRTDEKDVAPRKVMDNVDQFRWSSDGRYLAATSPLTTQTRPKPAMGGDLFPPTGADEASKSNTEIVNGYYQRTITQAAHSRNDWEFHLAYAHALESLGDISGADAQYQIAVRGGNAQCKQCIAQVLENDYQRFKTRHSLDRSATTDDSPQPSSMHGEPSGVPGSFVLLAPGKILKATTVTFLAAQLVVIDVGGK